MGMDQYLLIPFLGEHPFTSFFDVHQGYKVLHCHIYIMGSSNFLIESDSHLPGQKAFRFDM